MSNRPNARSATGPGAQEGRSLVLPIVIGVVVFAAIGAIVLTVLSGSDDEEPSSEAASGEVCEMSDPRDLPGVISSGGTALPNLGDPADDPAVGMTAPTLEGVDLCGEPMTVGGPSDEPSIVIFLAHWCPHCQREVPLLSEWLDTNGQPEGVQIIGITTAFDEVRGNWPPGEWLAEEGWEQPTMVDPTEVAYETYGQPGFPYYVVLDPEGKVVMRASGEQSIEQIEAMVAAALASTGSAPTESTETTATTADPS